MCDSTSAISVPTITVSSFDPPTKYALTVYQNIPFSNRKDPQDKSNRILQIPEDKDTYASRKANHLRYHLDGTDNAESQCLYLFYSLHEQDGLPKAENRGMFTEHDRIKKVDRVAAWFDSKPCPTERIKQTLIMRQGS